MDPISAPFIAGTAVTAVTTVLTWLFKLGPDHRLKKGQQSINIGVLAMWSARDVLEQEERDHLVDFFERLIGQRDELLAMPYSERLRVAKRLRQYVNTASAFKEDAKATSAGAMARAIGGKPIAAQTPTNVSLEEVLSLHSRNRRNGQGTSSEAPPTQLIGSLDHVQLSPSSHYQQNEMPISDDPSSPVMSLEDFQILQRQHSGQTTESHPSLFLVIEGAQTFDSQYHRHNSRANGDPYIPQATVLFPLENLQSIFSQHHQHDSQQIGIFRAPPIAALDRVVDVTATSANVSLPGLLTPHSQHGHNTQVPGVSGGSLNQRNSAPIPRYCNASPHYPELAQPQPIPFYRLPHQSMDDISMRTASPAPSSC